MAQVRIAAYPNKPLEGVKHVQHHGGQPASSRSAAMRVEEEVTVVVLDFPASVISATWGESHGPAAAFKVRPSSRSTFTGMLRGSGEFLVKQINQ